MTMTRADNAHPDGCNCFACRDRDLPDPLPPGSFSAQARGQQPDGSNG